MFSRPISFIFVTTLFLRSSCFSPDPFPNPSSFSSGPIFVVTRLTPSSSGPADWFCMHFCFSFWFSQFLFFVSYFPSKPILNLNRYGRPAGMDKYAARSFSRTSRAARPLPIRQRIKILKDIMNYVSEGGGGLTPRFFGNGRPGQCRS